MLDWHFITCDDDMPSLGASVFVLVEDDIGRSPPVVRCAELARDRSMDMLVWMLLDHNQDIEEEILQQTFTVVAWRHVS